MNFGMVTPVKDAENIMSRALGMGINFFDTSNSYGGYDNRGASEAIIGNWLHNTGYRNRVFLATKVYHETQPYFNNINDAKGISAYKIRVHLEESLRRLKTDHIDLYQIHHLTDNALSEEVMFAFERAFLQGKITYTGSCNFSAFALGRYQTLAEMRNKLSLVSEQHKYNLLCRLPELEILPAVRALGISLLVWSPLEAGILSAHAFSRAKNTRASHNHFSSELAKKIKRYQQLCRRFDLTPQTAAVAWLLANNHVCSVIIGPRTEKQLGEYEKMLAVKLPEEFMNEIDNLFTSPGGEAPVAYAW
jgi:aryl-alcohol dehydrogenase-like predicted oxidoreductase